MFRNLKLFNQLIQQNRSINRTNINLIRSFSSSASKGPVYVNVLDENDKILFKCKIDEAKRYAKKNDFILMNYEGPIKTKVQQMKLVKMSNFIDDNDKQKDKKKNEAKKDNTKKVLLKETINDHDLDIKMKKIAYYLSKNHRVRMVINGQRIDQKTKILEKVKKKFAPHLLFKQIVTNANSIKLYIVADKTFADYYEENLKNDKDNYDDLENEIDETVEEDLINEDLDDLINEKLK